MAITVSPDLSIELAPFREKGLALRNPVIGASGTFGYGTELEDYIDVQQLGAIICKGVTRYPRDGNPQPRLVETAAGLLNTIGLQNIGVETIVQEKAPVWARWQTSVIVNISGDTVEEYGDIAGVLEGVAGVSGVEVNIGCPNVERGGLEFGIDPQMAAAVTESVRAATSLPMMVKLTPNVTDIVEIARAVAGAGADSVSLVNTFVGMAIDVAKRRPGLSTIMGGLSGPAIKPISLAMVYKVADALDIPVIGIGGIASARDALEFIMAGASAVQVGTASFLNPGACAEVLEGIQDFMRREGIAKLSDLVGVARVNS
ncbi:MAG: dihydroorotate dehydrogenase [Dehalococcoidia bacterium]